MKRRGLAVVACSMLLVACSNTESTTSSPPAASPSASRPVPSTTASSAPSASALPPATADQPALLRTAVPGVRLRVDPDDGATILATLPLGALLGFIGGPVSGDGLDWYEVRFGDESGWVAAGADRDWLTVVRNGRIGFGTIDENDERPTISVASDGSDRRTLLPEFGSPHWSPDGSRAAVQYQPVADDEPQITVVDADGANRTDLGTGFGPAWSPDGTRLAWTDSERGIGLWDGGGDPVRITVSDHGGGGSVAWSPDGTTLAFVAIDCPECPPGGPIVGEPPMSVYVFEPPSGAVRKVADGGWGGGVTWSPDGSEIAYGEYDFGTGGYELRVVNLASGDVSVIGTSPTMGYGHAISPDWSRIVSGTEEGIMVSRLDGSDPTVVVPAGPDTNPMPANPRWSPDGEWILYDLVWTTGDAIYPAIVRADGTGQQPVGTVVGYDAGWQPMLEPLPLTGD